MISNRNHNQVLTLSRSWAVKCVQYLILNWRLNLFLMNKWGSALTVNRRALRFAH